MSKNSYKNQSKRNILTIISVLSVVLIGAIIFVNSKSIKTYKEINFTELKELVDSEEKFILFIGSDTCSHCTLYKETLNGVIKKNHVIVNYIDINKLSDTEISYIKARFAYSATPTTVFIGEGKEDVTERVLAKKVGSLESTKIIELFKKYEYIKE